LERLQDIPIQPSIPVVRREWGRMALLCGGLVILFGGQLIILRDPPRALSGGGFLVFLFGLVLVLAVLGWQTMVQMDAANAPTTPEVAGRTAIHIKPGWLLLAIGLSGYASLRALQYPPRAFIGEYALLWFGSMLALVAMVLPQNGQPYPIDRQPIRRKEWVLIGFLVFLAAIPRLTELGTVPYLFDGDESKFAEEGLYQFRVSFVDAPFGQGIDSHTRVFTTQIALAIALFGNTVAASRLPPAIAGTFGILAIYLLGREIYGKRVALLSSLFAVPWVIHIFFSKQAMNQPYDPLFVGLAIYFMLRGLRRRAPVDFALSGIFLGHAQMYYLGGRLGPFVMVAYLVYQFLRDKSAPVEKRVLSGQLRALLIIPLTALIVVLPQNVFVAYFNLPLSTRADKIIFVDGQFQANAAQGLSTLINYMKDQVFNSFNGLYVTKDRSGWVGPGSPVMGVVGGPLLLIGVAVTLFGVWKRPRWCIPLGWAFTVLIVTCVLGIDPPVYERYFPAVTALALLAGLGADSISVAFGRVLHHPEISTRIGLGVGALLLVGGFGFYYFDFVPAKKYLEVQTNFDANLVWHTSEQKIGEGRFVIILAKFGTDVFLTPIITYPLYGSPYYMTEDEFSKSGDWELDSRAYKLPLTFLLPPERMIELAAIRAIYPDGKVTEHYKMNRPKEVAFYTYDTLTPALPKPASPE